MSMAPTGTPKWIACVPNRVPLDFNDHTGYVSLFDG